MGSFTGDLRVSLTLIAVKWVIGDDYKGYKITMSVKYRSFQMPSLTVVHKY